MSNPRKKIIYDEALANPWEINANNHGPVVLYDASGDPILTDANPGVIEATDLDIRALDPVTDEVTVQATDLDIRDLDSATDSVTVASLTDTHTESGGSTKQSVYSVTSDQLLIQILKTLKKIEYHLMLATDTEIKE